MAPRRKTKSLLNKVRDYRKQRKKQLANDPDLLRKERRMWEAARAREKRASQDPVEAAARRWRDAQRARERRAKMSPDALRALRQKDAVLKRRRRQMETEEQRAVRRSAEARKARDRRASMPTTTAIKKMGVHHFMELAERTNLQLDSSAPDPLRVPADDNNVEWIKREVDQQEDEFSTISEMCIAALASIPGKGCDNRSSQARPVASDRPRVTLELSVSSSDSNDSDDDDGSDSSNSDVGDEKPSEPVLKIVQIETLISENNGNRSPKSVTGESGTKTKSSADGDEEDFARWEAEQKTKEGSCKPNNVSAFRCDICDKSLSSRGNVRLHKMKRHRVKTPFCCKVCGSEFDYRRDLVQHRNKVHRNKQGLFECECGKTTYEFHNFLTHLAVHRKPAEKTDEAKAIATDDLGGDRVMTDDEVKRFACEHCSKRFKRPDSLKTHRNLVHMEDGGEMAERARKSAREKGFACDTCGRRFGFQCLLRDHMNIHAGLKPYACTECDRAFSQRASLKQHLRAHGAERRFKCVECPGAFFSRGDLAKHVRKHTGERPYICEVCGEGYAQSSHLNVHRRSHSGERPFPCDLCGRGFTKSSDVARHRRIHTGELPFLCQVCGRGFRQSAQCRNHIRNHHPETTLD